MAGRPLQLDTSAKFGPWSATLASAGAALAATAVTDWVGSPVTYVPIAAFVLGIVAFGIALLNDLTRGAAFWRALCLWSAGVWSWVARTHEAPLPFGSREPVWWANAENWYLAIALMVFGGITSGTMAFRARRSGDRAAAKALKEAQRDGGGDSLRDERAKVFRRALADVCNIGTYEGRVDPETGKQLVNQVTGKPIKVLRDGARIRGIEAWPVIHGRSHGYTVDGDMPPGVTYSRISDLAGLASYLGLPKGCGVEVDEGETGRNSFIARVQTHNAFVHDYPYPDELVQPHSADEDTPTGVMLEGTVGRLPQRYDNTTLAGEPDAGKSNATHVLGIWDTTGVDALLVDFDLSKGLSVPYIESWFRAQMSGDPARMEAIPAPGVAMTCPNLAISWFVSECLLEGVAARKGKYGRLMRNMKLKVAPSIEHGGVPLIRARVDEGGAYSSKGSLIGNRVRENLEQVAGQGRPAAIRVLWCGLRGVDEFIPTNVAVLSRNRVALRPTKPQELGMYLGWDDFPDIKRAQEKGQAYIKVGTDVPHVERFYRLGDDAQDLSVEEHVARICEQASQWQPEMDPAIVEVFNRPRLVEIDEAIDFFKGGPGVTTNEDGTVTVENFWDNRWKFVLPLLFPEEYEGTNARRQPVTAGATASTATSSRSATIGGAGMNDLDGGLRKLNRDQAAMADAMSDLDAAKREAARREAAGEPPEYSLLSGDGDTPAGGDGDVPADEDEIAKLNALIAAPAFDPRAGGEPKVTPQPTPREQTVMMLRIIAAKGDEGITASRIQQQLNTVLERHNIEVQFQTVYKRLKEKLMVPGLIDQPWGPGPGAEPRGRYVITAAGREFMNREG